MRAIARCVAITVATGVLGTAVAGASPITWQFEGYNAVTYPSGPLMPAPVTSGPFTIQVTFDPDGPHAPIFPSACPHTNHWPLIGATFTWGGVNYPVSLFDGGVFTNETYAEVYCPGTWVQMAFVSHDQVSAFWVGLLFQYPDTVGNDSAPRDPSHAIPLYAQFNWGPFPGPFGGPYAQAIGTFTTPTLVAEPTSLLLVASGMWAARRWRRRERSISASKRLR